MKREFVISGQRVVIQSGDIALSMFHGGPRDFFGKIGAWAITWVPWKKAHTPYNHAMAFGDLSEDQPSMVSAERGSVKKVALADYLKPKRSILILRPDYHGGYSKRGNVDLLELEKAGIAAAIGVELEKLVGRKYSKIGLFGHALDTIITFGGRLTQYRPFAYLLGGADPAVYCSEAVALAADRACGYRFLRFRKKGSSIPPVACRPRDIYWTARKCAWKVLFRSDRGQTVPPQLQ